MTGLNIHLVSGKYLRYRKPRRDVKGWLIEDIVWLLNWGLKNYSKIAMRRMPAFTRQEVLFTLRWVLFKRIDAEADKSKSDASKKSTDRQKAFVRHYFSVECFGNGAKAARLAGYSSKRAKQTAYEFLRGTRRRRY